mmetsp:Transcript_37012/g.56754  ORF Transcript_37012/g.56754 Transcript_37012/m.56754 type:complete len:144 (+) Transcript_37012:3432-3863(+)
MYKLKQLFQSIEPVEEEAVNYNEYETEQSMKNLRHPIKKAKTKGRRLESRDNDEEIVNFDGFEKRDLRKKNRAQSQLEREVAPKHGIKPIQASALGKHHLRKKLGRRSGSQMKFDIQGAKQGNNSTTSEFATRSNKELVALTP